MNLLDAFQEKYGIAGEYEFFTPYRVCPVGAHSDHQLGRITGIAIDKGITIACSTTENGAVRVSSLQFEQDAAWTIQDVPEKKVGDWADYLRGATYVLRKKYRSRLQYGIQCMIRGELPIGGLSSSATLTLCFLKCLAHANSIELGDIELVHLAYEAEKEYVGVSVGKMDQSCEVFSRKGHLLYLDTMNDTYELIPTHPQMKPYEIGIFFSGLEHSLVGSAFNMRVDEAKAAGYALLGYAGLPYGKFNDTHLRYVSRDLFDTYKDRLPLNWAKRAEHWYSEFERVQKAAEAWKNGNLEQFGQLSFESGWSSIYNWETGSPELKCLYEILKNTKGVYGGRFSGAGFKGCCIGLIDPEYRTEIMEHVRTEYLKVFPEMATRYNSFICTSADGIGHENNSIILPKGITGEQL